MINSTDHAPVYQSVGNCNNLPGYSCNFAGYLYTDPTFMRKVGANFNQPSASEAWSNQCDLAHCDITFWVGLQDSGGTYLVQTGNDAGLYCGGGTCNGDYYYYTWYEDYPNPSLNCFNTNVGDQITASVYYSHTVIGRGYSELFYDTYLKDNTNGQSCSSDWSPGPGHAPATWAEFVGERPEKCCSYYVHLPKFSPAVTFSGGYYVNNGGSTVTIGSNWAYEWIMNNGQYCTNIANSAVSSGSFTETWLNSCGT